MTIFATKQIFVKHSHVTVFLITKPKIRTHKTWHYICNNLRVTFYARDCKMQFEPKPLNFAFEDRIRNAKQKAISEPSRVKQPRHSVRSLELDHLLLMTPEQLQNLTDRRHPYHQAHWLHENRIPYLVGADGSLKVLVATVQRRLTLHYSLSKIEMSRDQEVVL